MKVTLIEYTGKGSPDPLSAARLLIYTKNTRLEQGAGSRGAVDRMTAEEVRVELGHIARTIRSSWEFVDFVFEISGVTRAFTHQLVRTRTASYAQQAQRAVDMTGFQSLKPETVKGEPEADLHWEDCMDTIGQTYERLRHLGIPAQDARGVLPTNVLTNIIVKMNLRTLADLTGKRINPRAQGEYTEVMRATVREAEEVMPWVHEFLFPERTATPALDRFLARVLGSASPVDMPEVNAAMKEVDMLKGIWG